jgi:hypothetical protein
VIPSLALGLLLGGTAAQDLDLRLARGEWENVIGQLRKEESDAGKTADLAKQARVSVQLARAQVTSNSYHLRDEQLADTTSQQALERAKQNGDDALLADALLTRGKLLYFRAFKNKRWVDAQQLFEGARAHAAAAKDPRAEAEAWFYLGLVEQQQDRLDAGDERFQKGLALARTVKDPLLESYFHRHLAASAEDRGRVEEAEKGFVESERLRTQQKACVLAPFAQITLAEFYGKHHRSEEKARPLLQSALASASRCGSNLAAVHAHLHLARTASTPAEKKKHAEEAVSLAKRFDDEDLVKEANALLGP